MVAVLSVVVVAVVVVVLVVRVKRPTSIHLSIQGRPEVDNIVDVPQIRDVREQRIVQMPVEKVVIKEVIKEVEKPVEVAQNARVRVVVGMLAFTC